MAHYLLDRLAELARRNATTLALAGVDVLSLDDDVGMPGTMMIGPGTWREFFRPRLAAIVEAARAAKPDIRVIYHSDGHIEPILDDLIDIGIAGINPVQPEHMDAARIRRRYGSRLALWGTVGRQTTFSFATPDEIRAEVRLRVETLGRAGLVLCPAYDVDEPDVPWANVAAFLEAGASA
jgi:uroporphyrinogen decarboxylase